MSSVRVESKAVTSDIVYGRGKLNFHGDDFEESFSQQVTKASYPVESTSTCLRRLRSSGSHLLLSLGDDGVFETEELDTIVHPH